MSDVSTTKSKQSGVKFLPALPDPVLVGAAQGAMDHFAQVGLSFETAKAFRETLAEAGLAVSWTGRPDLFVIGYAQD